MSEGEKQSLEDVIAIDGLYNALVAEAESNLGYDVVIVNPGMGETSRITGALDLAYFTGAETFICGGVNDLEAERGDVHTVEQILKLNCKLHDHPASFKVVAPHRGPNTREQSLFVAGELLKMAHADHEDREPLVCAQTGGSWLGPRSFLALVQAVMDTFRDASAALPRIFPVLVPTQFGSEIRAATESHKRSNYGAGLMEAITGEVERRRIYTPRGHLANLATLKEYLTRAHGLSF